MIGLPDLVFEKKSGSVVLKLDWNKELESKVLMAKNKEMVSFDMVLGPGKNVLEGFEVPDKIAVQTKFKTFFLEIGDELVLKQPIVQTYAALPVNKSSSLFAVVVLVFVVLIFLVLKRREKDSAELLIKKCRKMLEQIKDSNRKG